MPDRVEGKLIIFAKSENPFWENNFLFFFRLAFFAKYIVWLFWGELSISVINIWHSDVKNVIRSWPRGR